IYFTAQLPARSSPPAPTPQHSHLLIFFFFFNDTATTEIYTLSLHDALPISYQVADAFEYAMNCHCTDCRRDRKSTRLNSSHTVISYAVFCLKKKKTELVRLGRGKQGADLVTECWQCRVR